MAVTIKMLLTAVVFCAITRIATADQCQYIECVFEGTQSRDTELDVFLSNLNNSQHGSDVAQRCAALNERIARCEAKKTNCPTKLTKPWNERMQDFIYVEFIMSLAKDFCQHPQQLTEVGKCFNDELQTAVKSCVREGANFNASCVRDQYNRLEKCPDSADKFFALIVDAFVMRNPYWAQSAEAARLPVPTVPARCEYVDCILEGAPRSSTEVEMYLAFFVAQESDNAFGRCSVLAERIERCQAKKANCPSIITKPWNERLTDPVYMEFLMSLGKDFCKNPQQLKDFSACFTVEIHTAVQTCVRDGPNFNASCIRDHYTRLEKCPLSTDEFFFGIIQSFLVRNPYRNPSGQLPSGSDHTYPTVAPKGSVLATSATVSGQCEYIECAFDGAPRGTSEVQMYLSHFLNQQAGDVAARCTALTQRAVRCEAKRANCPTNITKPWEERMKDPIYVDFLMTLGRYFCKDPQKLKDIGDCFNDELHTSLQSCLPDGLNFNVSCIFDQYTMLENCPEATDVFFGEIVNHFLKLNPYWNKGEDEATRRERMHKMLGLEFV